MSLRDVSFQSSYNPDNCSDIIGRLYEPALAESVRYDRTTYGFSPAGLITAAAGIASLVRNGGHIQLICDQTLDADVVQAVIDGRIQAADALRANIPPESLTDISPEDIKGREKLELVTWMVRNDLLEIKVAIRASGIFHPKIGILTDLQDNRIAFNGSANESVHGWESNYEYLDVFCSWDEPRRVADKEEQFQQLWEGRSRGAIVIPIPDDYQEYLKQVAPQTDPTKPKPPPVSPQDERDLLWSRIRDAIANDPATTAETVAAELWPHQENFRRQRATGLGPDRILIADEVGLGKTIQAGILLKTRMNQGKVNRLLILTPKSTLRQWQQELRHKFNIDVPILERSGSQMVLIHSDGSEELAPYPPWDTPCCLISYHWLRRNRQPFLASDPHYDTVIVDEAHHARFQDVNDPQRRRPNQFLTLLREVSSRTRDLILLTATPMQISEAELWALLNLLEPQGWNEAQFSIFYDESIALNPGHWRVLRDLYREKAHRPEELRDRVERLIWHDNEMFVGAQLDDQTMQASAAMMRSNAPPKRNMSRHTRGLLKRYQDAGLITMTIPERKVQDDSITMSPEERELYEDINELVNECYGNNPALNQTAVGFIMTVYRKRLGSSAHSYACSIQNHLDRREEDAEEWELISQSQDEDPDVEDPDYILPGTTLTARQHTLLVETKERAQQLARHDTKYQRLLRHVGRLEQAGHRKIIIFTQFQDTQDYLADRLANRGGKSVTRISGQDARIPGPPREERIRAFRDAEEGILICTETAAESLNLQFCTALVNYDVPWNPMTLEQRIGRIDRIGQERETIDVINLFYADTAEYDAYRIMGNRMKAIEENVGPYRPIMQPNVERIIANAHRTGASPADLEKELEGITASVTMNLDLLNTDIEDRSAVAPEIAITDLTRILNTPDLMPEDWTSVPAGPNHWRVTNPHGQQWTVTTDRGAHNYAPDRVEWWGPGSPSFPST